MKIERAQKKKQKLKIALAGISGSGKTYSALTLAFSMCQKVCVIDTECGSASLYSDHFPEYDVLELQAPYSPQRYIEAIKMAETAGYECIIIDSLSHEWNGTGGCLDMVNAVAKIDRNSYTAWGKVTPHHDSLINHMISAQTHIIVTMRTKTAYEMGINDKGKQAPVKVGMAPTQRDGVEYEFTIVFDIDQSHNFTCSKDRTSLFNNVDIPQPLNKDVGKKILDWLDSGIEPVKSAPSLTVVKDNEADIRKNILIQFTKEAEPIRDEYRIMDADEGCNGNDWIMIHNKLFANWFTLCSRYKDDYDWFEVPPKWQEGMSKMFGIEDIKEVNNG